MIDNIERIAKISALGLGTTLLLTGCGSISNQTPVIGGPVSAAKLASDRRSPGALERAAYLKAHNEGRLLIKQGRWPEAEQALVTATKMQQGSLGAWADLGEVYYQEHKDDLALEAFRRGYSKGPGGNVPIGLYEYAKLARRKGFLEEEYKALLGVLQCECVDKTHVVKADNKQGLDSDSLAMVHMAVGNYYMKHGRHDDAREEYEAAKFLEPRSTKIRYALSWDLRRVGLMNDAYRFLKLVAAERNPSQEQKDAEEEVRTLGLDKKPGEITPRPTEGALYDANRGTWTHVGPTTKPALREGKPH